MRNQGGEDRPHRATHRSGRRARPSAAAKASRDRRQVPRAPDASLRGRDHDPPCRLKRGSRLPEELDFLGGGFAAESGIAVRKAPEARDDLVVPSRASHVFRVEPVEQGDRAALCGEILRVREGQIDKRADRKSTRLNSSHLVISYAVFCLKKKTTSLSRSVLASCCSRSCIPLPCPSFCAIPPSPNSSPTERNLSPPSPPVVVPHASNSHCA